MQDFPLRVTSIIDLLPIPSERKIMSKDTKGKITDTNYKNIQKFKEGIGRFTEARS